MPLFHPPFKLYPYQADLAAKIYFNDSTILAASTGMGKTVMSIGVACMCLEDDKIDFVMVACESNKVGEWEDDLAAFSDLKPVRYAGTLKKREKLRAQIEAGEINCIVGVYETLRNDMVKTVTSKRNKSGETLANGPLLDAILKKRVLYIKDEGAAKMGSNRGSMMYRAHERLKKKHPSLRVIEISATPVDKDPEGYYNLARLCTDVLGNVEDFYNDHVAAYNDRNRPSMFKNLDPDMTEPGKVSLKEKLEGVLLVKSKRDPDVVHLFPKEVPDYTYVRLSDNEREFYRWLVHEYANDPDNEAALYTVLRQFCGHPMALTLSEGAVAQNAVQKATPKLLKAMGASKLESVTSRVKSLVTQDERVVLFTFFGQSVLPLYAERFREEGWRVSVNHGGLSADEKSTSKAEFRAGDTQIFLSSDAGARGINLPEAAYVEEIDFPLKWSTHVQRISRVSRVDSKNPTIWWNAWAVKDTLEDDIIAKMMTRKGYADTLVEADQITNSMMRDMLKHEREVA